MLKGVCSAVRPYARNCHGSCDAGWAQGGIFVRKSAIVNASKTFPARGVKASWLRLLSTNR
jgi:hypothetical protein